MGEELNIKVSTASASFLLAGEFVFHAQVAQVVNPSGRPTSPVLEHHVARRVAHLGDVRRWTSRICSRSSLALIGMATATSSCPSSVSPPSCLALAFQHDLAAACGPRRSLFSQVESMICED